MYAIGRLLTDIFGRDKNKKRELLRKMGYTNFGKGFSRLDKLIKEGFCSQDFGENLIKALGKLGFDSETVEGAFKETYQQMEKEQEDYARSIFKPYLFVANERKQPERGSTITWMGINNSQTIDLPKDIGDIEWEEQQKIVKKASKQIKNKDFLVSHLGNVIGFVYRKTYDDSFLFDPDGKFVEKVDFEEYSTTTAYFTVGNRGFRFI